MSVKKESKWLADFRTLIGRSLAMCILNGAVAESKPSIINKIWLQSKELHNLRKGSVFLTYCSDSMLNSPIYSTFKRNFHT